MPKPPATLQGAATWRIQCHDPKATSHIAGCCNRANSMACYPRATYHIAGCSHLAKSMSWSCHIAGCKNSISHIENRFSPHFIFFVCFLIAFWALTSGGFRIVSDTLVNNRKLCCVLASPAMEHWARASCSFCMYINLSTSTYISIVGRGTDW